MMFSIHALNFSFLNNVEKQKRYAMLNLVRISWYRMLSGDQSVQINETCKGYDRITFHQKQQKIDRKFHGYML